MIDGFVLLAPLLLLPILLLLAFVGCAPAELSGGPLPGVDFTLRFPEELAARGPRALFRWRVDGATRSRTETSFVMHGEETGLLVFESEPPVRAGEWTVWVDFFTERDGLRVEGPRCTARLEEDSYARFDFEVMRPTMDGLEIVVRSCP